MDEEPRIRNEEMEKKGVDQFSKGKDENNKIDSPQMHILEDTEGKDDTANANGEPKDEKSKIDSPATKTKKPNHKTNYVTVPQPFSLATEKRMMRERKGSMDFKKSKPILISKSASFNHKSSHLKGNGSSLIKKCLQPKDRTNGKDDKNTEKISSMKDNLLEKAMEKKQLQVKEGDKMKERTTFKALPLPNFYRQKDCPPPKSEAKKMVVIEHSKPPMIGDQVKKKTSDNKKTEGNAVAKRVSKGIGCGGGGGAKETISKVVKKTKSSLGFTPKETIKDLV